MLEPMPELRTPRLRLRPFVAADIGPAYLGWLHDSEALRFSNQRFRSHTADSCAAYLASFEGSDNVFVSIRLAEGDQAIGTMTAYRSRHHGTADIGILLGERSAWGQGLGQEAWDAMLGWLAGLEGMRKLTCGTLAGNLPMRRLAERSGMTLEGVRRAQELVGGEPQDMLLFARFTEPAPHRDDA
jgi:[ribosomal protein S5]-alanine N-acetyltransferase